MARTGLAVGGIALIGLGAAIGLGWWWPSTSEATVRLDEPVRAVRIANDSGDVTVRAGKVERTTVRQKVHYSWDEPERAYELSDGKLVLSGCGAWCSVDYEVTVPRGARVAGSLDSGDLTVTGTASADVDVDSGHVSISQVAGDVAVEADSGDVELRDIGGQSTVDADSGSVSATGLRAPLQAQLSSGDLTAYLAEPVNVHAEVSSGDIELVVPRAQYHVEAETSSGNRDIDVARNSSSQHRLVLHGSSGDVTVHTPG